MDAVPVGEVAQWSGRESDQINSTWKHFHLLSDLLILKFLPKRERGDPRPALPSHPTI